MFVQYNFLKPTEQNKELRSPPAKGGYQVIPLILGIPNLSIASSNWNTNAPSNLPLPILPFH